MTEWLDVSEDMRAKARLVGTEVCWSRSDIKQALRELAHSGRVILGFDIFTFDTSPSKPHAWGTSGYDVGADLKQRPWDDVVKSALELAFHDVDRTTALSGLKEPLDDVWYCVASVTTDEANKQT